MPIEKEINNVMVDILKDCVEDGKAIIKRQQIIIVLLVLLVFILTGYHTYTVTKNQGNKVMISQKVASQGDGINVIDKADK